MKYIKSLLALMLLLAATGVMAATVSVNPITVTAGQSSSIVINLTNSETTLTAYQMTLNLPTGVTVKTDDEDECVFTKSSRHKSDHTVTVTKAAEGRYLIVCFSTSKKVISGTSGELLSIEIDTDTSLTGTVQGSLTGITFSDTNKQKYTPADVTFNITMATKTAQTLSLTTLPEMTEGDAAYTLPQKTDQNLTLTWSVANTTIASISAGKLTPLKAGTTTVTATQAGNDTYQSFTKTFTLTVNERPTQPTVEVTDISQLDNVIYIEPMEANTGIQTTISFKMKNTASIRGFQFDLVLPEGVTPVEDDGEYVYWLNADRAPKKAGGQLYHTLEVTRQADGFYRFLSGAQADKTFMGNDGEVAVFKVNIADDMQEGDYPVVLKNVKLTETDISIFYLTDEVVTKLTIAKYIPGDINGDGIVDVSDYIGVANHILGNTPAGFNALAADVNKDNVIDVSDYIGIANIILTGSIYGNANARTFGLPKQEEQMIGPQ